MVLLQASLPVERVALFPGAPAPSGLAPSALPVTRRDVAKLGVWGGLFLLDLQPGQGGTFWGYLHRQGRILEWG